MASLMCPSLPHFTSSGLNPPVLCLSWDVRGSCFPPLLSRGWPPPPQAMQEQCWPLLARSIPEPSPSPVGPLFPWDSNSDSSLSTYPSLVEWTEKCLCLFSPSPFR